MDTVTVSFSPNACTQAELREELGRAVGVLIKEGVAQEARVEPIFPGDLDARWKGAFLVRFIGQARQVVEALRAIPGIESAYVAPGRSPR